MLLNINYKLNLIIMKTFISLHHASENLQHYKILLYLASWTTCSWNLSWHMSLSVSLVLDTLLSPSSSSVVTLCSQLNIKTPLLTKVLKWPTSKSRQIRDLRQWNENKRPGIKQLVDAPRSPGIDYVFHMSSRAEKCLGFKLSAEQTVKKQQGIIFMLSLIHIWRCRRWP